MPMVLRSANGVITPITRMHALPTAITGRSGLAAASSLASGRGTAGAGDTVGAADTAGVADTVTAAGLDMDTAVADMSDGLGTPVESAHMAAV